MGLKNTLIKILAYLSLSILSFLLISIIPLTILLFNANNILFDPATYEQKFTKFQIYDKLKNFILDSLLESLGSENARGLPISKEELKNELSVAVPTSWVKAQIDSLVRNLLLYLRGDTEEPDLRVNFQEIKPSLSAVLKKITAKYVQNESSFQIPQEIRDRLQCSDVMECIDRCKLPQYKQTCDQLGIDANMTEAFGEGPLDQIPDSVNLWEQAKKSDQIQYVEQLRGYIKLVRSLPLFLIIMGIVLIVLIAIVSHNLKSTPRWIGTSLFFGGISGILLGYMVPNVLESSIQSNAPEIAQNEAMNTIVQVVLSVIKDIGNNTMIHSVLVLALGIMLITVSLILSLLDKPKSTANPKEPLQKTDYIR